MHSGFRLIFVCHDYLYLRHHPKMKSSNMKEMEELFYEDQYTLDPIPKHHVMNVKGRYENVIIRSLDLICMWRRKLCVPAAVTQGSIGWLALRSAADEETNFFPW
jgi:hypothetical protein